MLVKGEFQHISLLRNCIRSTRQLAQGRSTSELSNFPVDVHATADAPLPVGTRGRDSGDSDSDGDGDGDGDDMIVVCYPCLTLACRLKITRDWSDWTNAAWWRVASNTQAAVSHLWKELGEKA